MASTINPDTGALQEGRSNTPYSLRETVRNTLSAHNVRITALEDDLATTLADLIESIEGTLVTTYAAFVTAAAANTARIVLGASLTVTSALTIPRGTQVVFGPYMFVKGTGGSIQFNGSGCKEAGRRQIFSGWSAGDIYGNFQTNEVYPEWWGLVGTGYSDGQHDIAINCAIKTHGPIASISITSAASASAGAETTLTVSSSSGIYAGYFIRIEASSSGDTEYDGLFMVTAVPGGTEITISKAWTDTMTGTAYTTTPGSTGNTVSLAAGAYYVSRELDLRMSRSILKGAGSGSTEILATIGWTPTYWFESQFGIWLALANRAAYNIDQRLGASDVGMITGDGSHAWMILIGSASYAGGHDFRSGIVGVTVSGYYAMRGHPTKRVSLVGGNGWAEENTLLHDICLTNFSGFAIGWNHPDSINTLNGVDIRNFWITHGERRGAVPIFIGSSATNCTIANGTIDCSLYASQLTPDALNWAGDWPYIGIYTAGLHTKIDMVHIEGVQCGIWCWSGSGVSSVQISNVDANWLMDEGMTNKDDTARVPGPPPAIATQEALAQSTYAIYSMYSAIVVIARQFAESSSGYNYNSIVDVTNLQMQRGKYLLRDAYYGVEFNAFGQGQYPNDENGGLVRYWRTMPWTVPIQTNITSAASHTAGTKTSLTVASSTGFTPASTIHIAPTSVGDEAVQTSYVVDSVPGATEVVVNRTWNASTGSFTGVLYSSPSTYSKSAPVSDKVYFYGPQELPSTGSASTTGASPAFAATCSTLRGQITTAALTTAGGAEEIITVTNTKVAATDTISLGTTYNGAGTPMLSVQAIGSGTFKIIITNVSASALDSAMVINFRVNKE